ncbi:MAG: endonuclease MutS2 [Chitinophagales bacterium]
MKSFPDSALVQLEFDKVIRLLEAHCRSEYAKSKALELPVLTQKVTIELYLQQTQEFKTILQQSQHFPNDEVLNLSPELKLLAIPGAVLGGVQFIQLRQLAESMHEVFRWFDSERKMAYPGLAKLIAETYYEKQINASIDQILDDNGEVRDSASPRLAGIRRQLYSKRNELRRVFDRVLGKLSKAGFVADIEEAFLNGRRVVAIHAENKRQVKGILLGESDTRRTSYIEPEETIELNNDVYSLEQDERREVYRLLRELTAKLSVYSSLLYTYHNILGEYDFVSAKAKLAVDLNANYPLLVDQPCVRLIQAFHPLLFLFNKKNQKPTIPTQIELNEQNRILVISGPNAGGKTVTLKTVGLLQLMVQAGLLIPVHPDSQLGIFREIMIHIGDTQSLEFELSTYSSHLKNMKYFIANANHKTLFFIDELGSGSDPHLGGAFAEVILEELVRKRAIGIVTTHYLNLKVMANKTPGIVNGAMSFDEKNLQPLYKLSIGKPGSSYTFSIAERIGLDPAMISRARSMVDGDHFRLDKLLNRAEQDQRFVEQKERELHKLLKENEKLRKEMEQLMKKEKHQQQVEMLKHQNKVTEERLTYLKDMERKLRQIIFDWKKSENKNEVIKQMRSLLFKQKEKQVNEKVRKKFDSKYIEIGGELRVGEKVMMKKNHQVGLIKEIRGKKAVVQLGLVPITVGLNDLIVVQDKPSEEGIEASEKTAR